MYCVIDIVPLYTCRMERDSRFQSFREEVVTLLPLCTAENCCYIIFGFNSSTAKIRIAKLAIPNYSPPRDRLPRSCKRSQGGEKLAIAS